MPSDGNKRHVGLQRLGSTATGRLDRQRHAALAGLRRLHGCFQAEGQALLPGDGHEFLRDLVIHARQDTRQEFDDLDLGAEARPDGAEFEPDIAGTDNDQLLRHLRQRQRTGRTDDPRFVDLDPRKARGMATRGDQDPLGLIASGVGPVADHDLAGTLNPRMALKPRDLVLLEKEVDPACQTADDVVFALHHFRQIKLDVSDRDAECRQPAAGGIGVMFGCVEKRLRGNASDIQAGAAKAVPPVDTGHFHAELRGTDGGDIATWAGADHDQVECGLAHLGLPA